MGNRHLDWRNLVRLIRIPLGLILIVLAWILIPDWVLVVVPPWARSRVVVVLLWTCFFAYAACLVVAILGVIVLPIMMIRSRRAGRPLSLAAARGLLLCMSFFLGLVLVEVGARAYWYRAHEVIAYPVNFPERDTSRTSTGGAETDQTETVVIAVLGESSALGEPYDPRLSVGQILAWQLERVFPRKRFQIEMLAKPGIDLHLALDAITSLKTRPDAVLVYSGHNEFQGRFSWQRTVSYYRQRALPGREGLLELASRVSPLCLTINETIENFRISFAPPSKVTRQLVDVPTCTRAEYEMIVAEFRARLESLMAFCDRVGAVPIGVIPPSNDSGYAPARSVVSPDTAPAERAEFAREFLDVRVLEDHDAAKAIERYRALLSRQPKFAETHFRLARLLEAAESWDEAREHYIQARELDGMPMRCPDAIQDCYRQVAARHQRFVVVDGPRVMRGQSPHEIVGDSLIQDAQHPTLVGYVAVTQDLLNQLHDRRAFGWPEGVPTPVIDPRECAAHFGIDAPFWANVCRRAASFYARTAYIRYDPTIGLAQARRLDDAAKAIDSGTPPEQTGMPGVGIPVAQ